MFPDREHRYGLKRKKKVLLRINGLVIVCLMLTYRNSTYVLEDTE